MPESCDSDTDALTCVSTGTCVVTIFVTTVVTTMTGGAPNVLGLRVGVSDPPGVGRGVADTVSVRVTGVTTANAVGDHAVVGLGAAEACPPVVCPKNEYQSSPAPMSSRITAETAATLRRGRLLAGSAGAVDVVMSETRPSCRWPLSHPGACMFGYPRLACRHCRRGSIVHLGRTPIRVRGLDAPRLPSLHRPSRWPAESWRCLVSPH